VIRTGGLRKVVHPTVPVVSPRDRFLIDPASIRLLTRLITRVTRGAIRATVAP